MQIFWSVRILDDFLLSDQIWYLAPEVGNPNITSQVSLRVGKLEGYFVAHVGVVVKVPGCKLSEACDRGSSLANRRCFFFSFCLF